MASLAAVEATDWSGDRNLVDFANLSIGECPFTPNVLQSLKIIPEGIKMKTNTNKWVC